MTVIVNSTLENVFLDIDNSKVGLVVESCLFNSSGIKVESSQKSKYWPVRIEDTTLIGTVFESSIDLINTGKISIMISTFHDLRQGKQVPVIDCQKVSLA